MRQIHLFTDCNHMLPFPVAQFRRVFLTDALTVRPENHRLRTAMNEEETMLTTLCGVSGMLIHFTTSSTPVV